MTRTASNPQSLRRRVWILAIVLLIYGAAFIVAGWYKSGFLTMPVDLEPGVIQSAKFRVGPATRYQVLLEVDRSTPMDHLFCLLGGVPFRPPCAIESVVDIQWTLRSGSQEIASGSSRNENSMGFGSVVTKTIGQFDGSIGAGYALDVVSMVDGSALAATNPRIVVAYPPGFSKGYFIFAPVLAFVAILVLIGLIAWTAQAFFRRQDADT